MKEWGVLRKGMDEGMGRGREEEREGGGRGGGGEKGVGMR